MQKLTPAIKEILQVFKKKDYHPLTLRELSQAIPNVDKDSINTRILRDNGRIFHSEGRPKLISVKPKLPEVIFFQNQYICRSCRQSKPFVDMHILRINKKSDPMKYGSYLTICSGCRDRFKDQTLQWKNPDDIIDQPFLKIWEYKIVEIEWEPEGGADYYQADFFLPKFREMGNSETEPQWFYLADSPTASDRKHAFSMVGIINAYGRAGWELAFDPYINENPEEALFDRVNRIILKRQIQQRRSEAKMENKRNKE